MPTRYLKPGICDSPHFEAVKSPQAEILYYRLLVTVDDFGRFDARPLLIKARCFPIREYVTGEMVAAWLDELSDADLIVVYEHAGIAFLQVQRWDNKPRSTESKFPQMNTDTDKCIRLHTSVNQLHTNVPRARPRSARETVTVTGTETVTCASHSALNGAFAEFWKSYPRKKSKGAAEKAWIKIKPDEQLQDRILQAVERAKTSADWKKEEQFIPYPASWLNAKGWEDEALTAPVTSMVKRAAI